MLDWLVSINFVSFLHLSLATFVPSWRDNTNMSKLGCSCPSIASSTRFPRSFITLIHLFRLVLTQQICLRSSSEHSRFVYHLQSQTSSYYSNRHRHLSPSSSQSSPSTSDDERDMSDDDREYDSDNSYYSSAIRSTRSTRSQARWTGRRRMRFAPPFAGLPET